VKLDYCVTPNTVYRFWYVSMLISKFLMMIMKRLLIEEN
jgi:hypothetical protein